MFGKNLGRQRPGGRIVARQLNGPAVASEGLTRQRFAGGVSHQVVDGIPLVRLPPRVGRYRAKNGGSTIGAKSGDTLGAGTVQLYTYYGGTTQKLDGPSVEALNDWPGTVPASAEMELWYDGEKFWVKGWWCT